MSNCLLTSFAACAVDEREFLYYVTHHEHAIKKMRLSDGKVEYIDNPEGYDPIEWTGVDCVAYDKEKIYLAEQNGRQMLQYSFSERKSRIYSINCSIYTCQNIAAITIFNEKVFICPSFRDVMIVIHLESGLIEEKKVLYSKEGYVFGHEYEIFVKGQKELRLPYRLFSSGCRIEKNMWLFLERSTNVICYELTTGKVKNYQLPEYMEGCIHAVEKDGKIYILTVKGKLYLWEVLEQEILALWETGDEKAYPYFNKIIVTDKNIWLLPFFGDDIYIVNLKRKNTVKYNSYPEDFQYYVFTQRSKYFEYCEDTDNYYVAMHCTNYLLIINKHSGKERWLKPIEPDIEQKMRYRLKNRKEYYKEEKEDLGKLIMEPEQKMRLVPGNNEYNGKLMWNVMKADFMREMPVQNAHTDLKKKI